MNSPQNTDFPITLNGQDYVLAYPLPAIWAFEDATGEKLIGDPRPKEEVIAAYEGQSVRARMQRISDFLWAGLITHHPELKREDVARMVFLKNAFEIEAKVNEAFMASLPAKEESVQEEGSDPLAETN